MCLPDIQPVERRYSTWHQLPSHLVIVNGTFGQARQMAG